MNHRNQTLAIFILILLGLPAFLGGCATTGMDRSVETSNSIEEVDTEIRKMIVRIDSTATSLETLFMFNTVQSDLKKAFDTYSSELTKLDKQGDRVIKRVDEMRKASKEYFAEWEKQGDSYTNPRIRELSDDRRQKLAEIYAQVPAAGKGIEDAYQAYLTNLKEIQQYLSNDLTAGGLDAIRPVAQGTVQDLDVLLASLRPVIYALDEINAELYRGAE
jgi:hypothetical protein